MRKTLVDSLLSYCGDKKFCMLCGDLGFNALEPLQEKLGDRFINAGIAEQNMISVAAGLARLGMRPWIYSIAPFIYARAFEQIRNDVCLHNLPVVMIGSGAGYGYGVNGPTHHALEDCGSMSSLQNMTVYTPAFKDDFKYLTKIMICTKHPIYLRLGRDEAPSDYIPDAFSSYRELIHGNKGIILTIGGMAGMLIETIHSIDNEKIPSLWVCGEMPVKFEEMNAVLLNQIQNTDYLLITEDHVSTGGLGEQFITQIMQHGVVPKKFYHRCAKGYITGLYGSQDFYREENGIGPKSLKEFIENA